MLYDKSQNRCSTSAKEQNKYALWLPKEVQQALRILRKDGRIYWTERPLDMDMAWRAMPTSEVLQQGKA